MKSNELPGKDNPGHTDPFRPDWREQGFALLPRCLDEREVDRYRADVVAVGRSERAARRASGEPTSDQGDRTLRVRNILERSDSFDALIDHPRVLPLLVDMLGPHLRLLGTELFSRRASDDVLLPFHTDGGPSMQRVVPTSGGNVLQVKVQYFLTDAFDDGDGLFLLLPGSHWRLPSVESANDRCFVPEVNRWFEQGERPPGAVCVRARAGDALVFPGSLWHAVDRKTSTGSRETINFRYGPLWCMPYDHAGYGPSVLDRLTPRQRRIAGDLGPDAPPEAYYKPADQDRFLPA